jgi:hypothetical protein
MEIAIVFMIIFGFIYLYAFGQLGGIPLLIKKLSNDAFESTDIECGEGTTKLIQHKKGDDRIIDLLFEYVYTDKTLEQVQTLLTTHCPSTDCEEVYSEYSSCTMANLTGQPSGTPPLTRTRQITRNIESDGGKKCPEIATQKLVENCPTRNCEIVYNDWSPECVNWVTPPSTNVTRPVKRTRTIKTLNLNTGNGTPCPSFDTEQDCNNDCILEYGAWDTCSTVDEHCQQTAGVQRRAIISRHPASGDGEICATEDLVQPCNDYLDCDQFQDGEIDFDVEVEKTSSFKFNATISYNLHDSRPYYNRFTDIYVCVSHTEHTEDIIPYSIDNDERIWMSLFSSTDDDDDVYASIGSRTFTGLSTGTCAITTLPYDGMGPGTTKDGITETYNARIIKIDTDGVFYIGIAVPFSCTPETVNPCLNISSDVLVARSYEEDYTRNFSFNPNFNALELSKDTFKEDLVLFINVYDWILHSRMYKRYYIYHEFDHLEYNDNFDYDEIPFYDDDDEEVKSFLYKDVDPISPIWYTGRYQLEITKQYRIQTYDTGDNLWREKLIKFVSRIDIEPLLKPIEDYTKEVDVFISTFSFPGQQLGDHPDGFIGTPNGTPFLTQCEDECNRIDECAGFTIVGGINEETKLSYPCHLKNNVAVNIHPQSFWDLYTKKDFTYDADADCTYLYDEWDDCYFTVLPEEDFNPDPRDLDDVNHGYAVCKVRNVTVTREGRGDGIRCLNMPEDIQQCVPYEDGSIYSGPFCVTQSVGPIE